MTADSVPLNGQVFADLADARLIEMWRAVQSAATRADPFGTLWWAQSGRSAESAVVPCVAVVSGDGGPLAVASFGLTPGHQGSCLTACAPQHRDLFDMTAIEDTASVAEALCEALPWDQVTEVDLRGIPADSPLGPALLQAAARRGLWGANHADNAAPDLSLIDGDGNRYPDYRSIMRGKTSKALRHRLARLGQVRYVRAGTPEDVDGLMAALFELHQKRWCSTPFPSVFSQGAAQKLMLQVARNACDAGALHLGVLYADEQALAAALGYVLAGTYYHHEVAHDSDYSDYSPGRTLLSFLLDDLLADPRIRKFSYLAGEESYKLQHATTSRPLCHVRLAHSRGRAAFFGLRAKADACIRRRPQLLALARIVKSSLTGSRYRFRCCVRRLAHLLRERSAGGLVGRGLRLAAAVFYERKQYILMSLDLVSAADAASDMTVRQGTLGDFNELIRKRYGFLDPHAVKAFFGRRKAGEEPYVACLDGEPVGSVWVRHGATYTPTELYGKIEIKADPHQDVIALDGWVDPACRGGRVFGRLVRSVASRMLAAGYRGRMLMVIDRQNRSSIRANQWAGCRPTAELEVVRLIGRIVRKRVQALPAGDAVAPCVVVRE